MSSGLLSQPARLGGILGIGFIVLFIVSILAQGDTPMSNDSAADIRAFYVDNHDQYLIADFVTGLALIFLFLPFAACMQAVLAHAEGEPAICSRLVMAGAIITLAIGGVASLGAGALALSAGDQTIDDSSIKLMAYSGDYGFSAIGLGFALTVLSASIVMLRTSVIAKWTGYFGVVVAVINIVGAAWVVDGDPEGALAALSFIGFAVFGLWVLATCIMLLRQPGAATATVAPAAA
jgi:hypothetical protein